ncbi:Uncharacterized protein dnm_076800 [Desulfonema magnum]|uniref:Uncharacterized protein n=1 Tax=Desulfonema magnum TaxID=45655 RepID=A0A975BTQ7_9BACT|nr:Uncharacterized protein dnm_076800 [Desulfonema magnum]
MPSEQKYPRFQLLGQFCSLTIHVSGLSENLSIRNEPDVKGIYRGLARNMDSSA